MWPNSTYWKALADGDQFKVADRSFVLEVIDCGDLVMPSGRLVACDPFAGLQRHNNTVVSVPPGRYPVKVTLADVSETGDGSHIREAYASLILHSGLEVERRVLIPLREG